MSQQRAVLSVDFESFAHTPAYRAASGTLDDPGAIGPGTMDRLLATFEAHDATATFFVVSEVAERFPDAITDAAAAGHEVASHTHTHPFMPDISREERVEELQHSKEVLESITGATVDGFRAPAFERSDDHVELLADTGYRYDSSVAPCRSVFGWYDDDWSSQRPTSIGVHRAGESARLTELPIAVMPGLRLPLSGAWLRFFGVHYTLAGMHWLSYQGIVPILYIHPWELVSLPDVEGVPSRVTVRTGEWLWRAIDRLLASPFEFVTSREVAEVAP